LKILFRSSYREFETLTNSNLLVKYLIPSLLYYRRKTHCLREPAKEIAR